MQCPDEMPRGIGKWSRRPARTPAQLPPTRKRLLYAGLVISVVATGLLWRSRLIPLPAVVSEFGGDALWALMVFVGIGFLLPRAPIATVALLAMTFSWGVEFSQLYHAPWIDAIRATLPGRLVLGSTFHWPDLPAYLLGIGAGAWAEHSRARSAQST
jgi:hypothetical protein